MSRDPWDVYFDEIVEHCDALADWFIAAHARRGLEWLDRHRDATMGSEGAGDTTERQDDPTGP